MSLFNSCDGCDGMPDSASIEPDTHIHTTHTYTSRSEGVAGGSASIDPDDEDDKPQENPYTRQNVMTEADIDDGDDDVDEDDDQTVNNSESNNKKPEQKKSDKVKSGGRLPGEKNVGVVLVDDEEEAESSGDGHGGYVCMCVFVCMLRHVLLV